MPIYEYRCRKCDHQFETMQRVGAGPLRKCPECSGRLQKLISRTSFHLKGGGWYAQGYSNAPATKSESKTKKSEPAKKPKKAEKAEKAEKSGTAPGSD